MNRAGKWSEKRKSSLNNLLFVLAVFDLLLRDLEKSVFWPNTCKKFTQHLNTKQKDLILEDFISFLLDSKFDRIHLTGRFCFLVYNGRF